MSLRLQPVLDFATSLGDVTVDATPSVIKIKRARSFVEIVPKGDSADVAFILSRHVTSPRVNHTLKLAADREVHTVTLTSADEIDAELLSWIAEAYESSPESGIDI